MRKSEYEKMFLLEDSHFWFVGKRYFIQTYLSSIKNQVKNILDVGCGTGGTTKFLAGYGKITGIEKNRQAVSMAKKRGIRVVCGEAEDLPVKKKSYSLLTLLDVLYHRDIKNIHKTLNEAKRVLTPSGFLLITDSAFEFLKSHHAKSVYEKRRFNLNKLIKILEKNNFKIIKSSYIYFSIFPAVLFKRSFLDRFVKPDESDLFITPKLINQALKLLLKLESFLLNYFKLPVGSSLIILARKDK